MKAFVVICVAFAVISASAAESDPIVRVTGGQVREQLSTKAEPFLRAFPTRRLRWANFRWREPMPVRSWAGIRATNAFGPPCAQIQTMALNAARVTDAQISQEDCLYLNVWTPEWGNKPQKPVMVYIHGGGNLGGASSEALSMARVCPGTAWCWYR